MNIARKRIGESKSRLHVGISVVIICCLFWLSGAVYAFTPELREAMWAVYSGKATEAQKTRVLKHYKEFNLMGLTGRGNGGVPDKVYQANQKFFARFNDDVCKDVLKKMKMEGTGSEIKSKYRAGTDTDINVRFKTKKQLRVSDIKKVRQLYNSAYEKALENRGIKLKKGINWAKRNETDFMPDSRYMGQKKFVATATMVNQEGGCMYEDMRAVRVEMGKAQDRSISIKDAEAYSSEMLKNIEKKSKNMKKDRLVLQKIVNKRNKAGGRWKGAYDMAAKKNKARIHLAQAQMAKYHQRLDDLNRRLRRQNDLPDLPGQSGMDGVMKRAAERRSGTGAFASEFAKKQASIEQHQVKNLAKTYAELASRSTKKSVKSRCVRQAGELSQKLTASNRKNLIREVDDVMGRNNAIARRIKKQVNTRHRLPKMSAFKPSVMGTAGVINDVFAVCDAYKKGGMTGAAEHVAISGLSGAIMGAGMKKLVAMVPSTGPALMVVGSGMTSYELTRNVMKNVEIGGKSLDQHAQEGIDNLLYMSAFDKKMRNANITKMLTGMVKKGKINLPEGMTLIQARNEALKRADRPGVSIFGFLTGTKSRRGPDPIEITLGANDYKKSGFMPIKPPSDKFYKVSLHIPSGAKKASFGDAESHTVAWMTSDGKLEVLESGKLSSNGASAKQWYKLSTFRGKPKYEWYYGKNREVRRYLVWHTDPPGLLQSESYRKDNGLVGPRREWDRDGKLVREEWRDAENKAHGVFQYVDTMMTEVSGKRVVSVKYFIHGKEVTKAEYLKKSAKDPTLPRLRE